MMKLTDIVVQKIIQKVLLGQDYRTEVLTLINAEFLQYAINFFSKVAEAKLRNKSINGDWYKREFILNSGLTTKEVTINSVLNIKTVSNSYGSARRDMVLQVAPKHYDELYKSITQLSELSDAIDITLTVKFRGVSVELNISESLIVINTLAVKRAELRGGAWSVAGKRVEEHLMFTFCHLFGVPSENYSIKGLSKQKRDVDFFLINTQLREKYNCEVKLMGRGNPESADAVIARDTRVFVADTLSSLNKEQLTNLGILWVELRSQQGYKKFYEVLVSLGIPAQDFTGDLAETLPEILAKLFPQSV